MNIMMSARPSTTVLVSILAVCLMYGSYLVYRPMALSYSGYCVKEGLFLTNDEKIRMVVERSIVGRNPPLPFWPLRDKDGKVMMDASGETLWVLEGHEERVAPVYYRNVNEFFALNPDCCEVRSYYADTETRWEPDFWTRLFGDGGGVVLATYQYRYRDRTGIEHISTYTHQEPINNCGESYRLF